MEPSNITIVMLTANRVPKQWAKYHKQKLLEAAGNSPIITISMEPLDWGMNILQDAPYGMSNIYVQLLKGAKLATTDYIGVAEDDAILARIQIDNSLDLGWKREDILIATDFPFEYNRVRSIVVPDGLYYGFDKNANKLPVVLYLIDQGLITPGELYWCHDFDAYELNKIDEAELCLENFDLGLVHYFYKPEWQFGSVFFRSGAKDIFQLLDSTIRTKPHLSRNNEKTLTKLIKNNAIDNKRYKKLNVTYSVMKRCLKTVYNEATKPIKVLHFRPSDPKDARMPDSALNMFMYGKNSLKIPLMNDRLIKIFNKHGIK